MRPMLGRAWRVRATWSRTARRVGLVHSERATPPWWSTAKPATSSTRIMVPPVRVGADRWGVTVDAAAVGRIWLVEFQNAARHLADAWHVPTVRISQSKAGVVRLRALVLDPLTEKLEWTEHDLLTRATRSGCAGNLAVRRVAQREMPAAASRYA